MMKVCMKVVDEDGTELPVPVRLAGVVRWLVTEAARQIADDSAAAKIVVNLGRGNAPTTTVVEKHQTL